MPPSSALLDCYAPMTPISGCPELLARQAADVFSLWQAWEDECGAIREVPYWALVWPAARVLTEYLSRHPMLVRGKTVLDCGCGCGVVAIAAARFGADRTVGCDMDRTALDVAQDNASANSVTVEFACRDVTGMCDPARFNVILAADLFYHKAFSARLFSALLHAHAQGAEVIIADSGRPFLPRERLVEIHAQLVPTSFDVEGCGSRTVRLYRFP